MAEYDLWFMARVNMAFVLFASLLATGCGGPPHGSSQTTTITESPSQSFRSANFVFHYTSIDAASIAATASRVEADYSRVLDDLGANSMPVVDVTFYTDHSRLEAAVRPFVGPVPPWTAGLVTSESAIHLMSPNLSQWGSYDHMISNVVHEFAHCVSLHVNPTIGNNPRWFWETVAIFESRQFVDPRQLSYMTSHAPPTLGELSNINDTRIYEIGFLLGEYVRDSFGQAKLQEMIRNNGDTAASLGLTAEQFQVQWFAFVRQRYGI
jgi:hypothetical protein